MRPPFLRSPLIRHVLLYGLVGGALVTLLQVIQYRWLIITHSVELYAAMIAALFAGLGIWLGRRLVQPREWVVETVVETVVEVVREVPIPTGAPFSRDEGQLAALGITPRELEILEQIAGGLSNREVATRLFVSENTVKTHLARLFEKLDVQRRTQAVQRARELRLIA